MHTRLWCGPGALDPAVTELDVGAFDGRPCDPVGGLLLPRVAGMRSKRVIEGLAVNILRKRRQMPLHGERQIVVRSVRHVRARERCWQHSLR